VSTVLIRADSSSTIGAGHIMRDLVLAERECAGDRVVFAVRDLPGNINQAIGAKGYETVLLEKGTVEELIDIIRGSGIDTLVIDHYGISAEEERRIKEATGVTLVVLDDFYAPHHCDILINHNIYAEAERYRGLVPEGCEVRCGERFTLIRDAFRRAKRKRTAGEIALDPTDVRHLFLGMGGTDSAGLNIPILETLRSFADIHIHVVTTGANRGLDHLRRFCEEEPSVTLYVDAPDIAEIMAGCDWAVVTPSVILHEVIYLGLPFVAIQSADNQAEMVAHLKERGQPVLEEFDPVSLKRSLWGIRGGKEIETFPFQDLPEEELLQVLSWRNRPEIRRWMFQTEPIREEKHRAFVRSLDQRGDRLYRLVKERGVPVGVFDLTQIDCRSSSAHIGIYTDPDTRGKGKVVMEALLHEAFARQKLDRLIAEVFAENERAIRLYRYYGFRIVEKMRYDERELLRMIKEL